MGSLDAEVASINGTYTVAECWAVGRVLEATANFSPLCQCGEVDHFVQESQDCVTLSCLFKS